MQKEEKWEVILDTVTQGWLPKQAAFEQRPEGNEDHTMEKSLPDKGNSKQKCWELGISLVYLKNFKERNTWELCHPIQQLVAACVYLHLAFKPLKLQKKNLGSTVPLTIFQVLDNRPVQYHIAQHRHSTFWSSPQVVQVSPVLERNATWEVARARAYRPLAFSCQGDGKSSQWITIITWVGCESATITREKTNILMSTC